MTVSADRSLATGFLRILPLALLLAGFAPPATGQDDPEDLLPDIIVRSSDLSDHAVVTEGDRVRVRLSNGTANVGLGPLYLYGVTPENGDDSQSVNQRIFRPDGSFWDREAGRFVFHPGHNHVHIDNWAIYRLRELLHGDEVGGVIAEGDKTSFCILDLAIYNRELPNFQPRGSFRSCASTVQGLSVGWIDIYDKSLPGQSIDITEVPSGIYWLESVVDPENQILEADEDNNTTRIRVVIGNPSEPLVPDSFEPNEDVFLAGDRPEGGPNSPNLGPTNPERVIESLSIHSETDVDYFKFYSNSPGTLQDFVRIDFADGLGDLDLALTDADGQVVASSSSFGSSEFISLAGRPQGWYFARVSGKAGATNPAYRLTVNPPANGPPSITVKAPVAGNVDVRHGAEMYTVTWDYADPENDPAWVTVYLNETPVLDAKQKKLPLSLFTQADLGFFTINSAEVPPGTYWVYCEITDGGTTAGNWSAGTVTFFDLPEECEVDEHGNGGGAHELSDCNTNLIADGCEVELGLSDDCNGNGVPDECDMDSGDLLDVNGDGTPDNCDGAVLFRRGDPNGDGRAEISDSIFLLEYLFSGGVEPECLESADSDNDGQLNMSDAILLLLYLFRGGASLEPPGPPPLNCGRDADPPDSPGDLGCLLYRNC